MSFSIYSIFAHTCLYYEVIRQNVYSYWYCYSSFCSWLLLLNLILLSRFFMYTRGLWFCAIESWRCIDSRASAICLYIKIDMRIKFDGTESKSAGVPIGSAEKNASKYVLYLHMWKNLLAKLSDILQNSLIWKNAIKIYQTKTKCSTHETNNF